MQRKFKNIPFEELFTYTGLKRLDKDFLHYLHEKDRHIYKVLIKYRKNYIIEKKSEFIINLSLILESFLAEFFLSR